MKAVKRQNKDIQEMTSNNTASVVNGKLILSFPNAENPVVWQMDLEKAASCALEIKEDKKTKLFSLVQKISDDQQNTIASFKEKAEAIAALMATSSALQNGDTKSVNVAPANAAASVQYVQAPQTKGEGKKAAILAFLLILLLVIIWAISVPLGQIKLSEKSHSANSTGTSSPTGEAVSADEFLKNR